MLAGLACHDDAIYQVMCLQSMQYYPVPVSACPNLLDSSVVDGHAFG